MGKVVKLAILAAFIVLLSISAVYGQNNKNSYVNDVEFNAYIANKDLEVRYHHYPFDEKYDVYGNGDKVHKFSDLERESEVIVKVKLNQEYSRKIYEECILSEIEILDVYKGALKSGDKVNLFEPVNCTEAKIAIFCSEGYSPMQPGEEYLMFLKPLKNSLFGDDEFVYLPSTVTYSKFKLDHSKAKRLSEEALEGFGKGYRYSKIKDKDVYLYDKEMLALFNRLRDEALEKYQ